MKAFSLVELLVVMTIIGLLTATAVPVYKQYLVRSNIASAVKMLEQVKSDEWRYFQANGVFGSLEDLGYENFNPSNPYSSNLPSSYATYYMQPYIGALVVDPFDNSTCPAIMNTAYISNFGRGTFTGSNSADYIIYYEFSYETGSVVKQQCAYYYYKSDGGAPTPSEDTLIENCTNLLVDDVDFEAIANSC